MFPKLLDLLNLRYYYHVDPALEGGDMELCGREPFDILASADAGENCFDFGHRSLKEALGGEKQRLPHCRVPIQEGGLGMTGAGCSFVFCCFKHSNHQGARKCYKCGQKGLDSPKIHCCTEFEYTHRHIVVRGWHRRNLAGVLQSSDGASGPSHDQQWQV